MKTLIGINGACGRMGLRLIQLAHADPDLTLVAALETVGHPDLGRDVGEVAGLGSLGVLVTSELPSDPIHAIIDFSHPAGTMAVLPACVARRIPLVVATTGHIPEQKEEILAAAHETALMLVANTSLVVTVLTKLVREAASAFADRGFDVEIIERHHRFKKDSPSGTALQLAAAVQEGMGAMDLRHGREGNVGERPAREIGIHAVRVGDNVGEHQVIFSALGETLELVQKAHTRDCYARGALQAAKFLANRPAGRYTMNDVLGL
jgi:4-hydroxy-tetrahydrodipicolinate reductase